MPETVIVADFPSCHQCGSSETISQRAFAELKEQGKIPKDYFTSMEASMSAVEDPAKSVLSVRSLTVFKDICAKCGMERVTRVQQQSVPKQAFQSAGPIRNQPGLNPFKR